MDEKINFRYAFSRGNPKAMASDSSPSCVACSCAIARFATAYLFLLLFRSSSPIPQARAQSIDFSFQLNSTTLNVMYKLLQDAASSSGLVDLTTNSRDKPLPDRAGKAFYKDPVRFRDGSDNVASFSTDFTFMIVGFYNTTTGALLRPGDGMAFFICSTTGQPPLPGGGAMGLNQSAENPFLAVEFDTYSNPWDPPGQHIGIDLNNFTNAVHTAPVNLTTGTVQQAWIDYHANSQTLEVRLAQNGSIRPADALVSATVDLGTFFPQDELFVGFSAATGISYELHQVYTWRFSTTGLELPPSPSPAPSLIVDPTGSTTNLAVPLSITGSVLFIAALALIAWRCRRRPKPRLPTAAESWNEREAELLAVPLSRYSYQDLSVATNGFNEEAVIGTGGFGNVYKGIMPDDEAAVAVKVLAQGSKQGHNQFLAELSVIGRLRHKNLVGLRGWCHDQGKLVLVYDYMQNGSLDKHLFSTESVLPWNQRYEIIKGVAEGLAFLHGGWEQRIVHRDIKAANVLLDSRFVAHLGDFGLAKLMEDSKLQQTMTEAGTRGYIAPELAYMGKASEKSDIYSFGILLLEVGCGRPVLDMRREAEGAAYLLDWVWQAQATLDLLMVADSRLGSDYKKEEMRVVLSLGLLCSHLNAEARPSMRKCCQILNHEVPLPDVPTSKPTFSLCFESVVSSSTASSSLFSQSTGYTNSSTTSALSERSSTALLLHSGN